MGCCLNSCSQLTARKCCSIKYKVGCALLLVWVFLGFFFFVFFVFCLFFFFPKMEDTLSPESKWNVTFLTEVTPVNGQAKVNKSGKRMSSLLEKALDRRSQLSAHFVVTETPEQRHVGTQWYIQILNK